MTHIASAHASHKPAPFIPSHLRFTAPSEVNPPALTERTGLLSNGTYSPFLPRNFYEAPQYARYRPASTLTLDVTAAKTLSISAVKADNILHSRKTLRTVSTLFNAEGRLTGAKINLSTGEIEAHDYKDYFEQGPKARRKLDAPVIAPFWMKFVEPTDGGAATAAATDSKKKRGQPPKVHINSLKPYLAAFSAPGFALAGLPFLDKIVTGVVNLDMDGNTRASAKKLTVSLLQRLDFISSQGVRDYMHLTLRPCCQRHSQKIAMYLRVIETAAAPIAKTLWPAPLAYEIDPCGRENCSVCTRPATAARTSDTHAHNHADGDSAVGIDNWSDAD